MREQSSRWAQRQQGGKQRQSDIYLLLSRYCYVVLYSTTSLIIYCVILLCTILYCTVLLVILSLPSSQRHSILSELYYLCYTIFFFFHFFSFNLLYHSISLCAVLCCTVLSLLYKTCYCQSNTHLGSNSLCQHSFARSQKRGQEKG